MRTLKATLFGVFLVAASASPAAAGVTYLWDWNPEACGGTDFETCISGGLFVVDNSIVVDIYNVGPGTITGVGLWYLPVGVVPTSGVAADLGGTPLPGWTDEGSHNDINGVVNPAQRRWSLGTTNGINDGLEEGSWGRFTFNFAGTPSGFTNMDAFANSIGVGVHTQGVGSCSSKVYVRNLDPSVQNPDEPGDIEDCFVSVPEPGTMSLLAAGALGMAFIARRRRDGAEIVDENGNDVEA